MTNQTDNAETRPPLWQESFRILFSDADCLGACRLESLFNFLQEAAANHANALCVGYQQLTENNRCWVLARLKIALTTLPSHGTTIHVVTWPSGFDRLFARRQFRLLEEDGSEFAVASSCWVLLDAERQRPLRAKELVGDMLPPHEDRPVYFPELDKLERRTVGRPMAIHVGDSMIDVNFHMNNARYVGMAADWLAEARPRVHVRELQVNYLQATRPGAELQVVGAVDGPRFDVEIREGDQLHCQLAGAFVGDAPPCTV